jgi:flagellar hook-associated protein 2
MKRLFALIAALLLSAVWMFAQDAAQAGSSTSSQTASSASEMTVEGCLSGSAGNFTLMDSTGKSYQLQGDTSKLTDQVGHQVRIKGTQTATASATTPSGGTASASTDQSGSSASSASAKKPSDNTADSSANASAAIQFNVTSAEKLSDNCTASATNK